MKRIITLLILSLISIVTLAQRTEGNAIAHLSGRNVVGSLPKPTYNAQIEGTVAVQIKVDQYGNVTEAVPGVEGTTVTNTALWNAARAAAMNAHFNQSADAPAVQMGTITYTFKSVQPDNVLVKEEYIDNRVIQFLGIPIDGSKVNMENQLIAKGFEKTRWGYLKGQFNGESVKVFVHTYHEKVDRIIVNFEQSSEMDLREQYNNLLSLFEKSKKYRPITAILYVPDDDLFYCSNKKYKSRFEVISDRIEAIDGEVWFSFDEDGNHLSLYYDNLKNRPHGEDL